jgi:hypothetical protein
MRFTATLELAGKTATGLEVPPEVIEALGGGKRPAVVVTIGRHSWRTTVMPYSGRVLLGVSAENRAAAGVQAGDVLDVHIEIDTAPREVDVPGDLAQAIAAAGLQERWDKLSYTHRKEHVRAVEEAKKTETRERRIAKALAMLRG